MNFIWISEGSSNFPWISINLYMFTIIFICSLWYYYKSGINIKLIFPLLVCDYIKFGMKCRNIMTRTKFFLSCIITIRTLFLIFVWALIYSDYYSHKKFAIKEHLLLNAKLHKHQWLLIKFFSLLFNWVPIYMGKFNILEMFWIMKLFLTFLNKVN